MLTYVTTNLFYSPAQTLVNTVNTVGVMGKGIALTFKELYPDMYEHYRRWCKQKKLDVGMLHIYRTPNKTIVNFPTKRHWRQKSQVKYIEDGLQKFTERYADYGISSVSFPLLGCGNGELDWEMQVKPVMESYLQDLPIPVYIHLYRKSPNFVPERLDPEYARQIRLERQRPSADQIWQDLLAVIYPRQLSLFSPTLETTDEHIIVNQMEGEQMIIYREDIEDLWNVLRLRGTLREDDVSITIHEAGAIQWLFNLLAQLHYIRPVELRSVNEETFQTGLQYVPLPAQKSYQEEEIMV